MKYITKFSPVLLLFIFSTKLSFCQAIKYSVFKMSIKYSVFKMSMSIKTKNNKWSEFESKESDDLATIDLKNQRVRVFMGKSTQSYDIIHLLNGDVKFDSKGNDIVYFMCVNENGSKIKIKILKQKNTWPQILELYVYYPNTIFLYTMKEIGD